MRFKIIALTLSLAAFPAFAQQQKMPETIVLPTALVSEMVTFLGMDKGAMARSLIGGVQECVSLQPASGSVMDRGQCAAVAARLKEMSHPNVAADVPKPETPSLPRPVRPAPGADNPPPAP